jgi:hypothetical protein
MRNSKLIVMTRRLLTPDKIPGINIATWFSTMESGSVILDGTTASQWSDISGNNRHATQATKANQPTYIPDGLNGKPVLSFDGTDILETPAFLLGNTVVTVARRSATNQPVVEGANVGALDRGLWGLKSTIDYTTHLNYGINGSPLTATNADGFPVNVPQIVSQTGAKGMVATNASIWAIGGGSGGYVPLQGFIAEFFAADQLLSTKDLQSVEGYFAWRWGTAANLANNHPFKFSPPYI